MRIVPIIELPETADRRTSRRNGQGPSIASPPHSRSPGRPCKAVEALDEEHVTIKYLYLAEDAVWSQPVSEFKFPTTGKITANPSCFAGSR